jgi:SAM-dependent methyltransferase
VLRFLDRTDEFYEGAYQSQVAILPRSERAWHVWPLWLVNGGYVWTVRRVVAEGSAVLELGCAGGVRYFGRRYHMAGCDLSLSSLRHLAGIYECLLQADASKCIPFPDQSLDAVVSSYFWEHISPEAKPGMLSECARVLRPGGKLVFVYDVETQNPLIDRFRRRDVPQYNRLFLDGDGHVGYQTPEDNLRLFREAGFDVIAHRGMEKTWLQSPSVYEKLSRPGTKAGRAKGWAVLLGRPPWFYLYTALLRLIDTLVCPLLPMRWARMDLTVCRKQSPNSGPFSPSETREPGRRRIA